MKKKIFLIITIISLFSLNSFSQVYKFKSTETDIEAKGKKTQTKYETWYHTFDFNKKQVTLEKVNSKNEKVKTVYPMKRFYQEGVTHVIVINQNGVKEVWFSMKHLGYDLTDGTRLACYNITNVQ